MSAKKKNDTLADLRALDSRTGVIFYMIPPSNAEGELDQRKLRGAGSLNSAQLCSALLWSCTGDLLRLAGSSWSSEAEKTKSLHKAGYGKMEAGFFSPSGGGQGEGVCTGQPVKSLPELIREAQRRARCTEITKSQAQSVSDSQTSTSQSWHCVHFLHQNLELMLLLFYAPNTPMY